MNAARSNRTSVAFLRPIAMALALVAGLALAAVLAGTASAHVIIQGSEPPADSVVATAPTQVIVQFSGEVLETGSTVTVMGPDGQAADNADGHLNLDDLDRRTLIATLRPELPNGVYTVSYVAYPSDGHEPAEGSYAFTVGTAGAGTLTTPASTPVGTPAATPLATPIALSDAPAASANSDGLSATNVLLLVSAALVVVLGGGLAVLRASRRH